MSITEVEALSVEDLGFQGKKSINIFPNVSSHLLTQLSYKYSINYLTISYTKDIIFAYLNNELKIVSNSKLSKVLENEQDEDVVLKTFNVPNDLKITQIQLNSNESTLLLSSLNTDNSMSLLSVDVSLLLNGTFNEQEIYKYEINDKILRVLPSPRDPALCLCLLESGSLHLLNVTNPTLSKKLFDSISSVCWFDNDLIIYSNFDDLTLNFYNLSSQAIVNSIKLDSVEATGQIFYSKKLNDSNLIVIISTSIESDESADNVSCFIELNNDYSLKKIHLSSSLFTPWGTAERISSFYTKTLNNWSKQYPELFISMCSKSSDIDISTTNQPIELINDSDRAVMPMDDDTDNDDNPLGFILDLSSIETVKEPCKGIDDSTALPRLIILSNRGNLISWNIWSKTDILNDSLNLKNAKNEYINNEESKSAISTTFKNTTSTSTEVPNLSSLSFGKESNNELKSQPSSIFGGSTTSQSNPFSGNVNPFGSTSENVFGSSTKSSPAAGAFGSSNTSTGLSVSSNASASVFGSSNKSTLATPFGQTSFGSNANTFKMGNDSASASGTSPFGNSASTTSASIPSTAFGNTQFGVGSFKMGMNSNNTATSKSKETVALTGATGGFGQFSKSSNAFSGLGAANSTASPFSGLGAANSTTSSFSGLSAATSDASPFGKIGSSTSTASPFGSLDKTSLSTETKKEESKPAAPLFGSLGANSTTTTAPFGNLSKQTTSASLFGSLDKTLLSTETKKEESKPAAPLFGSLGANSTTTTASFGNLSKPTTSASPFGLFNKPASANEPKKEEPKPVSSPFGSLATSSSAFVQPGEKSKTSDKSVSIGTLDKSLANTNDKKEETKPKTSLFGTPFTTAFSSSPFSVLDKASTIPRDKQEESKSTSLKFDSSTLNGFGSLTQPNSGKEEQKQSIASSELFGNVSNFTSKNKPTLTFESEPKIKELLSNDDLSDGFEEETKEKEEEEEEEEEAEEEEEESDEQSEEEESINFKSINLEQSKDNLQVPKNLARKSFPLDEQVDSFDFSLNSKLLLDADLAKSINEKKINVQGGKDSDYRLFLGEQLKFYEKFDENINKLVSEWETKFKNDKNELEKIQKEKIENEQKDKLIKLRKLSEERDKLFVESERERKKMIAVLKMESERRNNELMRLSKEYQLEEEISKKLIIQENYDIETIKLMESQINEMDDLYNKQKKIIEDEINLEKQRIKVIEEKAKAEAERLAKEQERAELEEKAKVEAEKSANNGVKFDGTTENLDDVEIIEKSELVPEKIEKAFDAEDSENQDENAKELSKDVELTPPENINLVEEAEKYTEPSEKFDKETETAEEDSKGSVESKALGTIENADAVEETENIENTEEPDQQDAAIESTEAAASSKVPSAGSLEVQQPHETISAKKSTDSVESVHSAGAKPLEKVADDKLNKEAAVSEPFEENKSKEKPIADAIELPAASDDDLSKCADVVKPTSQTADTDNQKPVEVSTEEKSSKVSSGQSEIVEDEINTHVETKQNADANETLTNEVLLTDEKSTSESSTESFEIVSKISGDEKAKPKKKVQLTSRYADEINQLKKSTNETPEITGEQQDNITKELSSGNGDFIVSVSESKESSDSALDSSDLITEKSVTVQTELIKGEVFKSPDYFNSFTSTSDLMEDSNINVTVKYVPESVTIVPEYTEVSTEVDKLILKKTAMFEEDETYFSRFYTPLNVPLLHARGNVEYPESFDVLPPMGKEMKKLIYDVFIDFKVLHNNITAINEYLCDQSNEDLIFHTLQNSSSFGNFWRFFEIETVLQGAERKAKIFSDLSKHYDKLDIDSSALKSTLFVDFRKISKYQDSLDKIEKKDMNFKKSYLNSNRPLSFENVMTRRVLREKVKNVQELDKTVQSEVLILKSQIYPDKIVKDERRMNAVIFTLQKDLYSHAETIASLAADFNSIKDEFEQPKMLESEQHPKSISSLSLLNVEKEPVHRISGLLTNLKAKKSLADVLKNKINNNRYIQL